MLAPGNNFADATANCPTFAPMSIRVLGKISCFASLETMRKDVKENFGQDNNDLIDRLSSKNDRTRLVCCAKDIRDPKIGQCYLGWNLLKVGLQPANQSDASDAAWSTLSRYFENRSSTSVGSRAGSGFCNSPSRGNLERSQD